jgi:hypothetical protein
MVGFQFGFAPSDATLLVESREPLATERARFRLVIVLDDSCKACIAQMSRWNELVGKVPASAIAEVLLISFRGDALVRQLGRVLHEKRFNFRGVLVKNSRLFSASTGIGSTPQTIVLDERGRIQLIQGGVLTEGALDTVATFVSKSQLSASSGLRQQ